jgi:hypothetical protein
MEGNVVKVKQNCERRRKHGSRSPPLLPAPAHSRCGRKAVAGCGETDHKAVMRARIAAVLLLAANGACSTGGENLGSFYVAPGKYTTYRCPDLERQTTAIVAKERELSGLMARAGESTSGNVVNALVYAPKLSIAREELRQLRAASIEKNCTPQPLPTIY